MAQKHKRSDNWSEDETLKLIETFKLVRTDPETQDLRGDQCIEAIREYLSQHYKIERSTQTIKVKLKNTKASLKKLNEVHGKSGAAPCSDPMFMKLKASFTSSNYDVAVGEETEDMREVSDDDDEAAVETLDAQFDDILKEAGYVMDSELEQLPLEDESPLANKKTKIAPQKRRSQAPPRTNFHKLMAEGMKKDYEFYEKTLAIEKERLERDRELHETTKALLEERVLLTRAKRVQLELENEINTVKLQQEQQALKARVPTPKTAAGGTRFVVVSRSNVNQP